VILGIDIKLEERFPLQRLLQLAKEKPSPFDAQDPDSMAGPVGESLRKITESEVCRRLIPLAIADMLDTTVTQPSTGKRLKISSGTGLFIS
jgi:hypothetical protein